MKIIKKHYMKKNILVCSYMLFLTVSAAEKKLNIQTKPEQVIPLSKYQQDIYTLKAKHAQQISIYQAHIAELKATLERERNYIRNNRSN